ncbi:serine O-acetyltransferase [Synechococcus sp. CS-602]|uniref:serine O-acetyltransferase n=1 Tax=Synechococcaceae TaxID=1890426 RepID=UPI0008FF5449|nr:MULTISPECIES: serine O-acetyltransferase [Synechococcaceae]MCT4365292.1 serine O-acetyltransferase [Candidatus Regnicoccus frigidus MAG-AL1]APD48071.1 serine O-acetyltransferase [Synechococcus sp. SynAce01]MCT0203038.1 serine O-acetyltransferase [Synechococcus sp. CS-603]MCT0203923.1 serine O-acetyltransferase [Synechococcus sp. CS-602]MCT0245537.1 serine O-acetyltransferase [Synechococcus sp. CS-601]
MGSSFRQLLSTVAADLRIIRERDPAARGNLEILLCYPGFHALVLHRFSHRLWRCQIPLLPRLLSQLARSLTGVEIHPGARIGSGVFIDHGMGVVIGETSEIGNRCLLYQGVTLGGTGKVHGKRHPTLGENVVVGAGANVLGAISVGSNTRIGAGSVVLHDVQPDSTVVGIPGRVVHQSGVRIDPLAHSQLPDAEARVIRNLMERIDALEGDLSRLQHCLREVAAGRPLQEACGGTSQNLKDREIIQFLGEDAASDSAATSTSN